mmetsp:Transcript_67866/g.106012  ORF Transcript_67866/g.106012 Transcript_67866/m.106012 type:complete len:236 (-) Transcript_67866:127-834(-)
MPKESPFSWVSANTINAFYPYARHTYVFGFWLLNTFVLRWLRTWVHRPRVLDSLTPVSHGKLVSVNIGHSIPKRAVKGSLVTPWGVVGDSQAQPYIKFWGGHGGFDKAVMLWSDDVINQVNAEGHKCFPGSSGEQLTVAGVDWRLVKTGALVSIGESALVEITYLKGPCKHQYPYFAEKEGKNGYCRISPKKFPDSSRVLARVLRSGYVCVGDEVKIFDNPQGKKTLLIIDDTPG